MRLGGVANGSVLALQWSGESRRPREHFRMVLDIVPLHMDPLQRGVHFDAAPLVGSTAPGREREGSRGSDGPLAVKAWVGIGWPSEDKQEEGVSVHLMKS